MKEKLFYVVNLDALVIINIKITTGDKRKISKSIHHLKCILASTKVII